MKIISLNGEWEFRERDKGEWLKASVPGCNFTDLLENQAIPDPFIGVNEKLPEVRSVAEKDWEYKKNFRVSEAFLKQESIELVMESLDTLADVFLNGEKILSAGNMFKRYAADVKRLLKKGENLVSVIFYSPVKYAWSMRAKNKLMMSFDAVAPAQYIRKAQYHFGWDWGPQLPPSGIAGAVYLKGSGKAAIEDVRFSQEHGDGTVALRIAVSLKNIDNCGYSKLSLKFEILSPTGETTVADAEVLGLKTVKELVIENPVLWQCNGFSGDRETQPLYRVNAYLIGGGAVLESVSYDIGLRTIELDESAKSWGFGFSFILNGRRIFAKGANWIPPDSFRNRVDFEKLDFLLRSMRDANMNMVRVWGGGYYESDEFYSLCDKYGILVWQDCCFACQPYPLTDPEFVENIRDEIYQNVTRIRHRASLALWCGNNELEQMAISWRFKPLLRKAIGEFFYVTLPALISEKDDATPYRASSPSGGEFLKGVNSETVGDTHLWRVWHGLSPYTYYRKVYTNFCSEFGMQSLPTMNTVRRFAAPEDYDLNSPVMKNHQKNMAGNSIMKYYLVSDFRSPRRFEDLIYLTEVIQAECMREPVEHWRRNMGRCNGALYWQYDDCWPVSSWASIDYYGNYKALQYAAKRFNKSLTASIENSKDVMTVYVINETLGAFQGVLKWRVESFDGDILAEGKLDAAAESDTAAKIADLSFKRLLRACRGNCVFIAELISRGVVITKKTALFKKEKKLRLPKSEIKARVSVENDTASIALTAPKFARHVMLELKDIAQPFSDNFFDLTAGESRVITVKIPGNWDKKTVLDSLSIKSLADVEPGASALADFLYKVKTNLKPMNIIKRIGYFLGI